VDIFETAGSNLFILSGIGSLFFGRPACSQVTVPTELTWRWFKM